jgi:hypothetical protein
MRCERHGLGAGPDGRCVLCGRAQSVARRTQAERRDHSLRLAAKIVVGIVAGIMAFALLLALFDTR